MEQSRRLSIISGGDPRCCILPFLPQAHRLWWAASVDNSKYPSAQPLGCIDRWVTNPVSGRASGALLWHAWCDDSMHACMESSTNGLIQDRSPQSLPAPAEAHAAAHASAPAPHKINSEQTQQLYGAWHPGCFTAALCGLSMHTHASRKRGRRMLASAAAPHTAQHNIACPGSVVCEFGDGATPCKTRPATLPGR